MSSRIISNWVKRNSTSRRQVFTFGHAEFTVIITAFYIQIIGIPRLSERIDCMLYRRRLELDIEETRPELDIARHAVKELKGSSRFRQVLKVKYCNFMLVRYLLPQYRLF